MRNKKIMRRDTIQSKNDLNVEVKLDIPYQDDEDETSKQLIPHLRKL